MEQGIPVTVSWSHGEFRYKVLPTIVKSALILGQTNAELEHSLSVNTKVVTKERASLNERTIVGLHVVKEAVSFLTQCQTNQRRSLSQMIYEDLLNLPMQCTGNG